MIVNMEKKFDTIWINGAFTTCEPDHPFIQNGAMAVTNGKIAWIGNMVDLQSTPELLSHHVKDLQGRCVTPGLIDCHTHLIYGGNRAHEFELRLQGASYEEIARANGGIQSTVNATRSLSEEMLFEQSANRLQSLMQSGVTTIEIKSGYGLDWPNELKMLRVAKRLEETFSIKIFKTFLAAHTFPSEYKNNQEKYVDLICEEMIPIVAESSLADAVDVFCEKIAFNITQTERIFKTAKKYGLAIKCHAEQLSNTGSAALAAKYQALSADHLEYASLESIKTMAESYTVAVLLPGAFYYLREKKLPPIELLRQYHVPIAIASDSNPGTSPILSLTLILNMACTLFGLTPIEALHGVTRNAAKALGIEKTHGTLSVGKNADFAVWNVNNPIELIYYIGNNPLYCTSRSQNIVE
jgi:imidazolonepropionase